MIFFHGNSGFLDDATHGAPPAGPVPVSPEQHATLMAGQAAGQWIVADQDGNPVLLDHPEAGPAQLAAGLTVTRFQARAALMQAGRLADVELATGASGDPFIQLAWAESVEFPRNSPTIAALAAAIGLTGGDVDQLFITASQISA